MGMDAVCWWVHVMEHQEGEEACERQMVTQWSCSFFSSWHALPLGFCFPMLTVIQYVT